MHRGYIKLWRKSLDSTLWQNHNLWRFWTYCLLKASHADHTEMVGFQEVELKTGEFVFGRKVAAKETGLSEQNIRTSISCLKSTNNITIKVTNKFSIIHVQNWEVYQETNQQINHQNNQLVTSKSPATNQQLTTNKNDKNVKNDKKEDIPYQEIATLFNATCTLLPKVVRLTETRKSHIKGRWVENPTIDAFKEIFQKVESSDFLSGRNGTKGWCGFDWVMNASNWVKIAEGNYINKDTPQTIAKRENTPEDYGL